MAQQDNGEMDLDSVLEQLGHFGRYQQRLYALILLPILLSGVYNSQYVFNAADLEYRCLVAECESPPYEWSTGQWGGWALEPQSQCSRRAPMPLPLPADQPCSETSFQNLTQRCDAWIYKTNDTIIAEFDLACQDWKRTLVGTVHSLGVFCALLVVGLVSDSMGRRNTFILSASSCAVTGMARSFATTFPLYLTLEFLDALLGAGVYSTGFVLALEMVNKEMRVIGGACMSIAYALGQVLLATTAWLVPYWRNLTRVLYAPSILFLAYFFFLDESVRWLLSKRRKKKAMLVLSKVARENRREVSMHILEKLCSEVEGDSEKEERTLCWQLVSSRALVSRVAICSFCWVTVTFLYYGLSINSVSLAGDKYVNYVLTSLVEVPGVAASVLTLDRFGRKKCIMTAFFVCGVSLLGLPFIPQRYGWGVLALSLVGKLCATGAFTALYVFAAELFPTPARVSALAACSMVGRLGQASAMLTPLLVKVSPWLPYVVFGSFALVAALLLLMMPETRGAPLPDTVAQAELLADSAPTPPLHSSL